MYKIKQIPEDFIVKEKTNLNLKEDGKFSYYLLKKKNKTTFGSIKHIAAKLHIRLNDIGFAGVKDKNAITEQVISIVNGKHQDFDFGETSLEFLGKGKDAIFLGYHEGNAFEIVVRDVDKKPEKISQIVNYFDDQRFSRANHLIGKAIVKGDFKEAIRLMLGTTEHFEKLDLRDYAIDVAQHLTKSSTDFVGALRKIPKKQLLMFTHAYQSLLWNKTVTRYLKKFPNKKIQYSLGDLIVPTQEVENIKIPIIGFGTELADDDLSKIMQQLLDEEEITTRDFVIRALPGMSVEGIGRDMIVEIKDMEIGELDDDEMGDKKKIKLKFFLPTGSYATMVVKQLF